jgi:transcriptional regulator with XRE-family HTH domain
MVYEMTEKSQDEYQREIGARVGELMRRAGYTPPTLAREMGLTSQSSVRKMIAGENLFQWTQLSKMARLLGSSPNQLLCWSEEAGLDERLVRAAVQAVIEQLGYDRETAVLISKIAFSAAAEHRALLEDPETEVRLRTKLAIAEAKPLKSRG